MTDYLSRQPYIDLLKSIIANQKDNPTGYSFAIDGEWGLEKLDYKKLLKTKNIVSKLIVLSKLDKIINLV